MLTLPFGIAACAPHHRLFPVSDLHQYLPLAADREEHRAQSTMIELTRLNSNPLVVNSDLIQYVESAPDTTLTLINGEKVVVRETCRRAHRAGASPFAPVLMAEVARHCSEGMVLASGSTLRTCLRQPTATLPRCWTR